MYGFVLVLFFAVAWALAGAAIARAPRPLKCTCTDAPASGDENLSFGHNHYCDCRPTVFLRNRLWGSLVLVLLLFFSWLILWGLPHNPGMLDCPGDRYGKC